MEDIKNMWKIVRNIIHVVKWHRHCLSATQKDECLEFLEDFKAAMDRAADEDNKNVH